MLLKADAADRGKRLDSLLHERLPEYSRSRLQTWIRDGRVHLNGIAGKPASLIRGGEDIKVEPASLPALRAEAEDIPLTVLYEDAGVVAIDKPAGNVVVRMPEREYVGGTVVNALLHRFEALSTMGERIAPGEVVAPVGPVHYRRASRCEDGCRTPGAGAAVLIAYGGEDIPHACGGGR